MGPLYTFHPNVLIPTFTVKFKYATRKLLMAKEIIERPLAAHDDDDDDATEAGDEDVKPLGKRRAAAALAARLSKRFKPGEVIDLSQGRDVKPVLPGETIDLSQDIAPKDFFQPGEVVDLTEDD